MEKQVLDEKAGLVYKHLYDVNYHKEYVNIEDRRKAIEHILEDCNAEEKEYVRRKAIEYFNKLTNHPEIVLPPNDEKKKQL